MKPTRRATFILAMALAGAVPGCDTSSAFRRCGFQGCAEDQRISTEIRALVAEHPELLAPNMVYIQSLDGVVYLSGQVATDLQRTTAEKLAHQAQGSRASST